MRNRSLRAVAIIVIGVPALLAANSRIAAAQAATLSPAVVWVDQFGDKLEGWSSVAAAASGVYVAGTIQFAEGPNYLRRYSADGSLDWAVSLSKTPYTPVVMADASRVCVGGQTPTTLDPLPSWFPSPAGYARCLNHGGSVQWTGYIEAKSSALVLVLGIGTSTDAVYVVGSTDGALAGDCLDGPCTAGIGHDAFIRKYSHSPGSADYAPEWTRQVDLDGYFDAFQGVLVDSKGNARVWGTRQEASQLDAVLRCYDASGDECVASASNLPLEGGAVLAGALASDAFYLAISNSPSDPPFRSVIRKYTLADGIAEALDPAWTDSIPAAWAYTLAAEPAGVVVAGTQTLGQLQYDPSDAFVRRYDEMGQQSWNLQFGTLSNDNAFAVALDVDRIYVSGQTTGSLEAGVTPTNGGDAFVARVARPEEAGITGLIKRIEGLVEKGTLKAGQGKSLIGKLEKALEALTAGDTKKAVTMLEAFIHQVSAFGNARILDPQEVDEIIAIAEAVIGAVSS